MNKAMQNIGSLCGIMDGSMAGDDSSHLFLLDGCLVKGHNLFDHFLQEDLGRGEQDMSWYQKEVVYTVYTYYYEALCDGSEPWYTVAVY